MEFEGERRRAELALDGRTSADLSDLQSRHWPSVGNRIREARLRSGLTDTEVARLVGISLEFYDDLERRGDEAFTVASLRHLDALGRILTTSPRVLLLGRDGEGARQAVTFGEVAARLTEMISRGDLTAEHLGDLIGWDIDELLRDPTALWDLSVEALYDICKTIGLDWVAAVPEPAQPPHGS